MKRNEVTIRRTKTATGYNLVVVTKKDRYVLYFHLGNYTPRNEYERGLKYRFYVSDYDINGDRYDTPTSFIFSSIAEAVEHIRKYWYIYI